MAKSRYEFTVLGGEGDLMQLADRCVVEAASLPEAASKYARLLVESKPVPVSVSWCEAGACLAARTGLSCEECGIDLSKARHVVIEEEGVTYSLCVTCEERRA